MNPKIMQIVARPDGGLSVLGDNGRAYWLQVTQNVEGQKLDWVLYPDLPGAVENASKPIKGKVYKKSPKSHAQS